jgi:peptidoglycan/xylan/chitin deacetylase (PgdA/CDA1 family)
MGSAATFANNSYQFEKVEFSESRFFPMSVTVCDSGECTDGGMKKHQIALTFDDGPNKNTKKVLSVLREHDVKGTFFVHVGQWKYNNYSSVRDTLDLIYDEGHKIANHGRGHSPIHKSTDGSTVKDYLMDTHNVIDQYLTGNDIHIFRNPGGYWSGARARMLNRHSVLRNYVGPIYWNAGGDNVWSGGRLVNAADWRCQQDKLSSSVCAEGYYNKIMSNYRKNKGSLVLMHDIHSVTAPTLDKLIKRLRSSGINWEFILVQDIPAVRDEIISI